ncbi:glycerophosphodiester phosphodiesterase [Vibrio nigripulchritudo]|uniref:glycerophosphodiester phosphodiesterase n=1 Tax=Vibrio nigripulchritudo TaxID=28173 RepID=UPI0005FA8A50|nr:glycerophosphodiester phosphodiesterase family protein [Vibrio nigripulchritudo]KJY77243.1 glycerophosphodiester phosphodiesterase [Vibrio nigripulchritudo]
MIIIAHRGARATHPENTLAAFQAALDSGAPAIELDIHEQDGELWVIHDKWLNRTTNGIGLLKWFDKSSLQKLDAGNGEVIPTLKQVMGLIQGQCALNIEVKGIDNLEQLYSHLDLALSDYGFQEEQLIVSSFNHDWLAQIKRSRPQTLIGALTGSKGTDKAKFAQRLKADSVNIDLDIIDQDFVQDAKLRGLAVYVYTVNQLEDWQWLSEIGVDGVFCDCPSEAIEHYPQPSHFRWK